MKKETKIIIGIVGIIASIIIIAMIGYTISYNYNADARNAKEASKRAYEAQQAYDQAKSNYDKTKRDIEDYQRSVNILKNAK